MKLSVKTFIPKEVRFQTPPLEGGKGGGKESLFSYMKISCNLLHNSLTSDMVIEGYFT